MDTKTVEHLGKFVYSAAANDNWNPETAHIILTAMDECRVPLSRGDLQVFACYVALLNLGSRFFYNQGTEAEREEFKTRVQSEVSAAADALTCRYLSDAEYMAACQLVDKANELLLQVFCL